MNYIVALVFHQHACEHVIAGTKHAYYICRTEKLSRPGGSGGRTVCLSGLGELLLVSFYVLFCDKPLAM
jgi:hypothetical protein